MLKLEMSRMNHEDRVLLYTVSFGGSMLLSISDMPQMGFQSRDERMANGVSQYLETMCDRI